MINQKITLLGLCALLISAPAIAADTQPTGSNLTKGSKSYQSSRPAPSEQDSYPANTDDVSQIEPAAGGDETTTTEDAPQGQKSLREEMRLPRKN
ncbi:MAG: hypothetical protein J0L77_06655 [Alphaproteobacteria bacterium]|nr:hypothetical protein [Alphaproteobacteria bacterium]